MNEEILIVDDDEKIRNLISIYLENEGYTTIKANDAFEALEVLEAYNIETTYSKSQSLKKLIDELFEYTMLSGSQIKLNYNKFDLCSLLEQIVGEYTPIFAREGLGIKKDIPKEDIIVNVDVELAMRVFDNLLINAKKYSLKPSEVDIKVSKENGKAILSISNKTNKIPMENLDKLFERFFKLDKARDEDEGTGLGLAIAKRITELHGGEIWAECNEEWLYLMLNLI